MIRSDLLWARTAMAAGLALTLAGAAHAQRAVQAETDLATSRAVPSGPVRSSGAPINRAAARAPQGPVGLITGRVNPQATVAADGTIEQELDESSLQYSVVRRNPDGSLSMYCVTGSEAANRALKGKVSPRAAIKLTGEHKHEEK